MTSILVEIPFNILTVITLSDFSYQTISSDSYCGHIDGLFPARCQITGITNMRACEDSCSAKPWCEGYTVGGGFVECTLITSTGTCEVGILGNGTIATSAAQLVPSNFTGRNCVGKIYDAGNNKYIQIKDTHCSSMN